MGALLYQSREKALLFENLPHGWRSLGQALSTWVNPQEDIVVIPNTHNHAMDAALPEIGATSTPLWQRLGSKLPIDATIPPPADAEARAKFERIRPVNPDLRLEDFAAKDSLALVRSLAPLFFGSKLLR